MDRLWGEFEAVPESQLRVLSGGEELAFESGSFKVAHTPGHASHHVSYLNDGVAFVGDTGGVRITPAGPVVPPTPPPDIDLEAWSRSIELIRGWEPRRLVMTHFGYTDEAGEQLDELSKALDHWAQRARELDLEAFVREAREDLARRAEPQTLEAYEQAVPTDQRYAGLDRYWRKATLQA